MAKSRLLLGAASVLSTLALVGGVVSAQTGSVSNTGPGSNNKVVSTLSNKTHVHNTNTVSADTSTSQYSSTGKASVKYNTTGGDAMTGDASTATALTVKANITNPSADPCGCDNGSASSLGGGTIDTTGPNSYNKVETKVTNNTKVTNTNTVSVNTSTTQSSKSGSATVSGNTTGGSAQSGDASSSTAETVDLTIMN